MNPLTVNSEADIFGRLIDAEAGELTKELAANILRVGFAEADHQEDARVGGEESGGRTDT